MASAVKIGFNHSPSGIMYIDINSCFATIEQQANPLLRNKPIAVVAYNTPSGCILAASVDSKKFGVKTGMRVKEARVLCPSLITIPTDPDKYRNVHNSLKNLLSVYTPYLSARSIDEFALNFNHTELLKRDLFVIAKEIKQKIKTQIGDYLTVSIGIGSNSFLAKTASNLHKPDGLDEINFLNAKKIYDSLSLTDLTGIAAQNCLRLNIVGIYTVRDFYNADIGKLKQAFSSNILSQQWYLRLRGWEVDWADWPTKSFGHTYSLPKPLNKEKILPILSKLVEKVGSRLRQGGYQAKGVHLGLTYQNREFWHLGHSLDSYISASSDIYKAVFSLLQKSPNENLISNVFITCHSLIPNSHLQLDLFGRQDKTQKITKALDQIEFKWGSFSVIPATMLGTEKLVPDRISFSNVP